MKDSHCAVGGPLARYEQGFREELASLGYGKRRASSHLGLLADLSGWLNDEGLAPAELTVRRVTQFLGVRRERGEADLVTVRGVALLLEHLRGLGVVPLATHPIPDGPAGELFQRYRRYLGSERGLAERGVLRYLAEIGPFVGSLSGPGGIDWAALSAADVTRFVVDICSDRARAPSSSLLAALRSFLRFAQGGTAAHYLAGSIGTR
jgi:integrase/recombinase XerD